MLRFVANARGWWGGKSGSGRGGSGVGKGGVRGAGGGMSFEDGEEGVEAVIAGG